jgi:hypothetical protein
MHLRGHDVVVDHQEGYSHLPQWDVEHNKAIGTPPRNLVVLLETGFLYDIPSVRDWDGYSAGVFVCPSDIKLLYIHSAVKWISSKKQIKRISGAENKYIEVSKIILHDLGQPKKYKKWFYSILKFLRIVGAVSAASAI